MKKKASKFFAFLFVLTLVLQMLGTSAFAEQLEPDLGAPLDTTPSNVTITFDSNGGSAVAPMTVPKWSDVDTLPTPTYPNNSKIFDGWKDQYGYYKDHFDDISRNYTLTAQWRLPQKFKITFDAEGGTLSGPNPIIDILEGTDVLVLPIPTRSGHNFNGWYDYYGNLTNSILKINKNYYLYADWINLNNQVNVHVKKVPAGVSKVIVTVNGKDYTGQALTETREIAGTGSEFNDNNVPDTHLIWKPSNVALTVKAFIGSTLTWVDIPVVKVNNEGCGNGINIELGALPKYKVTYNSNGGTPTPPAVIINTPGGSVPALPSNPSFIGHSFDAWYTPEGTVFTTAYKVIKDITVTARWTCAVTFDLNYLSSPVAIVVPNIPNNGTMGAQMPVNPTRFGYTFMGWNTMPLGGGSAFTNATSVTANVTVYAQWRHDTYTVSYNNNGGTGSVTDPTNYFAEDTVTVLDKGDMAKSHHSFSGWNTNADGSGTPYAANATFARGIEPITLYAQWTPDQMYDVVYDANGATGAVPGPQSYYSNETVTVLDKGELAKEHHTFDGWNTEADGDGISYAAGAEFVRGTQPITLYAQWKENQKYAVVYNANGATGTVPTTVTYYADDLVTVESKGNLVKANASFAGWNTKANGDGTTYEVGAQFERGTEPLTLYAQWADEEMYAVHYEANGATGGTAPASVSYYSDALVTVEGKGDLVRANYTFAGWNTKAGGDGTPFAVGATFTRGTEEITLYAQWTADKYTVTFNSMGGSSVAPITGILYNGTTGTLPIPTQQGYSFTYWYTGLGTPFTSTTPVTGNIEVFAAWQANVVYSAQGVASYQEPVEEISDTAGVSTIPQTGDQANNIVFFMLLSFAAISLFAWYLKRKENN